MLVARLAVPALVPTRYFARNLANHMNTLESLQDFVWRIPCMRREPTPYEKFHVDAEPVQSKETV